MGLLNKIFGGSSESKEEKVLPWIPLKELEQLNFIETKSRTKTQVLFKHSTRCGISSMVMNQFIDMYGFTEKELDLYYLDLLNYREVSNEIAAKFQVLHQSPQLLVIKNGVVVAHASHGSINDMLKDLENDMSKFLAKNSEFVDKGYFNGKLYQVDWYPRAIVSKNNSDKVYGLVFKGNNFDTVFKVLDVYEGVGENFLKPNLFRKELVTIYLETKIEVKAWVYIYNLSVDNFKQIYSGDFLKFCGDN